MKDVLTVFHNIWVDFKKLLVEKKHEKNSKYGNLLLIGILVAGLGYGGYSIYRWHVIGKEATAQKTFSEAMQLFEQAMGESEKWADVEGAFALGYEQNSGSKLAPLFQLFQAQALVAQGKRDIALPLMEIAIKKMPSDNPLTGYYKTKVALVKMDDKDTAVRAAGLKELESIANNDGGDAQDVALYYLGSYFLSKDEVEKARVAWQKLEKLPSKSKEEKSPYSQLASEKLKQLG